MADGKETKFWEWFEANERMLYEFETDRERIFDLLLREMREVDSRLVFEIGRVEDGGWREFVISADGLKEAFPAVENLFAEAPQMERWKFVKFRPRRQPMGICIGERCTSPEEVHFRLFHEGNKIGILLFFKDFDPEDKEFFLQVGYLMLDEALGEYTVETEVGFVEFADRSSEYLDEELSLPVLAREFDYALMQK